ncbi:MAG: hypothetical protein ABUL73_06375 [Alphaproteobacteria bacterium]
MLKVVLLLVIVGIAAYFTRPDEAKLQTAAQSKLHEVTSAAMNNADLGGTLGGLAAQASGGTYENFYVVARYSAPSADHPLVQCWGAFTLTLCNKTGSPQ